MKKIIATLTVLGLYCAFGEVKAKAWFSETHKHITESALELMKKEGKIKPYNFYKGYIKLIIDGSVNPDSYKDVDKGAGTHYYSCVNNKGKELSETKGYYKNANGKFSKSARTMLEDNYTSALCLYKSSNTEMAMEVLGRAIHFLSDMGCTVHVSNNKHQDKPTNVHNAYEKHINTLCKQFTADKYDKRLQKSYDGTSFENALHKLIKNSARFTEKVNNLDPKAFNDAGQSTIPVTQQNVMALMLKFYNDCSSDNGNYLLDQKAYTFKNEAAGTVITTGAKGLTLLPPDKSSEQKLQLCISKKGTFGIKIHDGGFVSENLKNYDYLKVGAVPAQFRFSALGNKRYRITTGGTGFEKVIACTKSGSLTITEFSPKDPTQVWIIG